MQSTHFSKHVYIFNKECIKTDIKSTVNALKAYIIKSSEDFMNMSNVQCIIPYILVIYYMYTD